MKQSKNRAFWFAFARLKKSWTDFFSILLGFLAETLRFPLISLRLALPDTYFWGGMALET